MKEQGGKLAMPDVVDFKDSGFADCLDERLTEYLNHAFGVEITSAFKEYSEVILYSPEEDKMEIAFYLYGTDGDNTYGVEFDFRDVVDWWVEVYKDNWDQEEHDDELLLMIGHFKKIVSKLEGLLGGRVKQRSKK